MPRAGHGEGPWWQVDRQVIFDDISAETGVLPGAPVPVSAPLTGRPDWDDWAIGLAFAVARRADCTRRRIGAVILDTSNRVVAVGYNGGRPGGPSCLAGACPRGRSDVAPGSSYDTGPGACIAIHAEQNALLYAGLDGARGAVLYCTDEPCGGCERMIQAAGIARVVWPGGSRTY